MLLTRYSNLRDSDILIKKSLENVVNYLVSQRYPKQIVKNICDSKFIDGNPDYYLFYPYMFHSVFNFHDENILEKLSVAGFLFYRSIILIDDVFDNETEDGNFNKFFMSNICQEETIKILSSFFTIDSVFWKTWNIRKFEYAKAYELDKLSHNIESFEQYVTLSDYKSSFGKIAIDALFVLTNELYEKEYNVLLESHKYFYVAFQILDDISDYEEDLTNNQFNISRFVLSKKVQNLNSISLPEQKKLLYIMNIAGELYQKALFYINESIKACSHFNLINWQSELQAMHNTIITHQLNIEGYIKYSLVSNNQTIKVNGSRSVGQAIGKAENYLINAKELDGSWKDFFNDAGVSDVWATSFTAYFLSNFDEPQYGLDKSKEYILSNMCYGKYLWGYNSQWIPDADSTSFGILSLHSMGLIFDEYMLKDWFAFQRDDGGFSTYRNKTELLAALNSKTIKNVDGWLSSHFCVSVVAYVVTSQLGIKNQESERLKDYVLVNLNNNEHQPYWWTSKYYSLSFIILACCINMDDEIFNLCCNELNDSLKKDKSIFDNEFFAGLSLLAISNSRHMFEYDGEVINNLLNYLFTAQKSDGSWNGNYSMRIPSPWTINPDKEVNSWKKDNKGTNVIVQDFNRVFTSVVCLSALKEYNRHANGD